MKTLYKMVIVCVLGGVLFWWFNIPILNSQKQTPYTIVVSTPLLKGLVTQLLGPDVQVVSIVPPNVAPELYVPSNQDLIHFTTADMVVMHSLDLPSISLDNVGHSDTKRIDLDLFVNSFFKERQGDVKYYWVDLLMWQGVAYYLKEVFKETFPEKKSEIIYRWEVYSSQLLDLQKYVENRLLGVDFEKNHCVTNDPALMHFLQFLKIKCQFISVTKDMSDVVLTNMIQAFSAHQNNVLFTSPFYAEDTMRKLGDSSLAQGVVLTVVPHVYLLNVGGVGADSVTYSDTIRLAVNILADAL
jgi:ABC-type Zn uptake system ZnuABC Zn-binding protein ZnuA